jgi:hypothetical protein
MAGVGTQYRSIEEYLETLEKRQTMETAPTAAVFALGSEEMLTHKIGDHPWITRVRCELPTRPLGPGGEEEPVRATYIGICNDEDPERYKVVVDALETIDVHHVMHLKAEKPTWRQLAHLEESDIVVIGDGDKIGEAWNLFQNGGEGLLERVKWRYYTGGVLIGIGNGAQFLGQRWWTGDPQEELDSRKALEKGEPDPHRDKEFKERYNGLKGTELCPAIFSTNLAHSESIVELQGSGYYA